MLGIARTGGAAGAPGAGAANNSATSAFSRFLMPVAECGFALESILEDLQRDPWPVQAESRAQRCTVLLSGVSGLLFFADSEI
jgi:protein transport protein SEC23